MKDLFATERENNIANIIEEDMVQAWLCNQEDVYNLYFWLKENRMKDLRFSEFEDVFFTIAANY